MKNYLTNNLDFKRLKILLRTTVYLYKNQNKKTPKFIFRSIFSYLENTTAKIKYIIVKNQ